MAERFLKGLVRSHLANVKLVQEIKFQMLVDLRVKLAHKLHSSINMENARDVQITQERFRAQMDYHV